MEVAGDHTSYRQVGVRTSGRLVKGPPPPIRDVIAPQPIESYPMMRPRIKRAVPSIPSKFDTTLHVGQRERDAFGGRTNRFAPSSNDLPGPGNYHRATTFIRSADTCGSVSKLGMGVGFVSKSKRFAGQERRHMQAALDPGPGQYDPSDKLRRPRNFSKSRTTGVFAKPRRYRDDSRIIAKPSPGPGDYNPVAARTFTAPPMFAGSRQASTFASKTKRDSYMKEFSVAPAPGHYTYDSSGFRSAKKRSSASGAVFRSTEPKLNNLYPAAKLGVPGPGSYHSKTMPRDTRVKEPHKPSSMFSNLKHNRWGIPFDRKTVDDSVPGPGAYITPKRTSTKVSASSHVFLSNVHRLGVKNRAQIKPPGPAFYKPAPVPQKSFLLNAARRWV